jgi:hypothetical protein
MPVAPNEANSPLVVNPSRMLPLPVTAERLQLAPGRRGHDAQFRRGMQLQQFPQRDALEGAEAPGMLISENLLGFFRREALNHTRSILRITLYVNGYDSKVGNGTALPGFVAPASCRSSFPLVAQASACALLRQQSQKLNSKETVMSSLRPQDRKSLCRFTFSDGRRSAAPSPISPKPSSKPSILLRTSTSRLSARTPGAGTSAIPSARTSISATTPPPP